MEKLKFPVHYCNYIHKNVKKWYIVYLAGKVVVARVKRKPTHCNIKNFNNILLLVFIFVSNFSKTQHVFYAKGNIKNYVYRNINNTFRNGIRFGVSMASYRSFAYVVSLRTCPSRWAINKNKAVSRIKNISQKMFPRDWMVAVAACKR